MNPNGVGLGSRRNTGELVHTLRVWLRTGCSTAGTARSLTVRDVQRAAGR